MRLVLSTVLVLLSNYIIASGFGANLSQPSKSAEDYINLPKEASYIDLDQFNGSLNTGFQIPLPKHEKELPSSLDFAYNSSRYRNLGYGLGFQIITPRFYKNPFSLRANYLFEYNGKFVEYNFDEASGVGHETDLTFFTKAKYNSDKTEILITFPNGKTLTFDRSSGHILKEQSPYKSAFLNYVWEEGLLKQIKLYNQLSLDFAYKECAYESKNKHLFSYGTHYKGSFINSSKCLSTITYSKDQESNSMNFHYKDGHLEQVNWKNGNLFPLFSAKYSNNLKDNQENIHKTLKSIDGSPAYNKILISKGKHGQRFLNRDKIIHSLNLSPARHGAKYKDSIELANTYFVDLDHDGITDVIVESIEHTMGKKDDDIFSNPDYGSDDNDARIPRYGNHHLKIYRGEVNQKGDFQLINNSNYQLSDSFKTMVPACIWHSKNHKYPKKDLCNNREHDDWDYLSDYEPFEERYKFQVFSHSSLLLGDFNGDGAVDLVSCGTNNFIAYNNYSGFLKQKSHKFPCTDSTSAIDINKDGLTDLISGKGVFVNNGNEVFTKINNDQDFKELINYHAKISEANYLVQYGNNTYGEQAKLNSLSTIYKDKKIFRHHDSEEFKIVEEKSFTIEGTHPTTRHSIKYDSNSSQWVEADHYKTNKITTYTNSFGGNFDIEYTVNGPKSVLKKITTTNGHFKKKTDLFYTKPIFEPILNQLVGFQGLKKHEAGASEPSRETFIIFFSDNKLQDNLKRVPIHGKIDTVAVCVPTKCSKLDQSFKLGRFSNNDFNQVESLKKYEYRTNYFSKLNDSFSYFKFNSEIQDFINYENSQTVKSTNSLYESFTPYGPLIYKQRVQEGLNSPYPVGGFSAVPYQEKISYSKIINNIKLPIKNTTNNFSSQSLPIKTTSFEYKFLNNEPQTIIKTEGTNKKIIHIDKFGRVVKEIAPSKNSITTNYLDTYERNVLTVNDNNHTLINYNIFKLPQSKTFENSITKTKQQTSYNYSSPYFLNSITHNDRNFEYSFKKDSSLKAFVTDKDDSSITSITYDQMGNKSEIHKQYEGHPKKLISKKEFNASSKLVNEYLPNEKGEEHLYYSFEYDLLNRLKTKNNHRTSTVTKYEFKDAYLNHLINDQLIFQKRILGTDVLSQYILSDDQYDIDQSISTHIISFKNHYDELNYSYDENHLISKITNTLGTIIYDEINTPLTRIINNQFFYTKDKNENIISYQEKDYLDINLTYDKQNRLTEINNSVFNSTRQYSYLNDSKVEHANIIIDDLKLEQTYTYTQSKKLQQEQLKISNNIVNIIYNYKNGRIDKIKNFIDKIKYDDFGNLSQIQYTNGLIANYSFSPEGSLKEFSVDKYKETNTYNNFGMVVKNTSNINKEKTRQVNNYQYTRDLRLKNSPALRASNSPVKRNNQFSLVLDNVYTELSRVIDYEKNEIVSQNFQETLGLLTAEGSVRFFSNDLHYNNGTFTKYIFINNKLIGAITISKKKTSFYPIITDLRNSVRLIYNQQKELITLKAYDEWGKIHREDSFTSEDSEKFIKYDYALLKRHHINSQFLLSNTRLYYPALGEWVTIDPLLFSDPESFLSNSIFEANGLTYAKGDPINFLDPSGQFAISTGLLIAGGVNAIAMGSAWVASKIAMWAGGTNTPHMNAQLNQGMLVGLGAGFAPAAVVGGGQLMMGAGRMGYQGAELIAGTAYMSNPTFFKGTMDVVNGAFSPTPPSNGLESMGFLGKEAWDRRSYIMSGISNTFDNFSNSFFDRGYQDDGFRFYDHTPSSNDPYSFGTWEF